MIYGVVKLDGGDQVADHPGILTPVSAASEPPLVAGGSHRACRVGGDPLDPRAGPCPEVDLVVSVGISGGCRCQLRRGEVAEPALGIGPLPPYGVAVRVGRVTQDGAVEVPFRGDVDEDAQHAEGGVEVVGDGRRDTRVVLKVTAERARDTKFPCYGLPDDGWLGRTMVERMREIDTLAPGWR